MEHANRPKGIHKILLTFDIEDFINAGAVKALFIILEMLKKYRLRAIFFISGCMAEKLSDFPEILDLLKNHEIGFHSSSHSVRPIIAEYADVKNYRRAYSISLERETSQINPLTGNVEREGGIYFLQDLFFPKKIEAYRAPGMSWTPPHLEALVDLGIKFDFSSNITSEPVLHRGATLYPYSFTQTWEGSIFDHENLYHAILRRKVAVFDLHPAAYVTQDMWDSIYYKGNPKALFEVRERPIEEAKSLFKKFELLLKQINLLRHARLIEVDPNPDTKPRDLITTKNQVQRCYETSIRWPKKFFNYNPRFVRGHFYEFFESVCR
jgi:hypothetical protein